MLLELEGANPNAQDFSGQTLLSHDTLNQNEEVGKMLLKRDEVSPDRLLGRNCLRHGSIFQATLGQITYLCHRNPQRNSYEKSIGWYHL